MKFSDKLAKLRKANNLTQEQLAEKLDITRQTISKWESGEVYPDMNKIISLCDILGCKLNELIDDGLIDEEKDVKDFSNGENTFKKLYEEFINAITKTYNMLTHMSFKSIIKLIFEMIVLGLLLSFAINMIQGVIDELVYKISTAIPSTLVRQYFYIVLPWIFEVLELSLAIIIFFQVFKLRYLDYYVTVTDNNVDVSKKELPIEENISAIKPEKEPIVIIRDKKHDGSSIFNFLFKIIIFILKAFVIFFSLFVIGGTLFAIAGTIFCLFVGGSILKVSSLILFGGVIFGLALLLIAYNIVFNHKQQYKTLLIMFIVSLLTIGGGIGLFSKSFINLNSANDKISTNIETKEFDLTENDTVMILSDNIKFEVDDSLDKTIIEFEFPKSATLKEYEETNGKGLDYYYELDYSMDEFKMILEDLKKDQLRKSYNPYDLFEVRVKCNSTDKNIFAKLGY